MTAAHAGLSVAAGKAAASLTTDPDADEEQAPAGRRSPTRRRLARAGKVLATTLAAVLFIGAAAGWGTKLLLDTQINEVAALDLTSSAILDPASQTGDENFLLIGSDVRGNAPGGAAKADSIMVAHLAADRTSAALVSFPRELEVNRPACQRWDPASGRYRDDQAPTEARVKLQTVYETGGPRCMTKVIQQITGLSINRFVGLDYRGFKEMVDAARGVEICVDRPVVDGVLGVVVPNAGRSTLTGGKALDFIRARNVRGDPGGDYGQIQRQQRLLAAVLRTALSDQVLLNPATLREFVGAFADRTVSDNARMDDLVTLAQSMLGLDAKALSYVTVPTTGEANARGNEVLREDAARALFAAVREDKPPPVAQLAAPVGDPDRQPTTPGGVKLKVLNASDRKGLAAKVADELKKLQFTVTETGNATAPADRTVIRYSPDRLAQAQSLAAAVPDAALQVNDTEKEMLQLVLGNGYDGVVSPLSATGGSSSTSVARPTANTETSTASTACR